MSLAQCKRSPHSIQKTSIIFFKKVSMHVYILSVCVCSYEVCIIQQFCVPVDAFTRVYMLCTHIKALRCTYITHNTLHMYHTHTHMNTVCIESTAESMHCQCSRRCLDGCALTADNVEALRTHTLTSFVIIV